QFTVQSAYTLQHAIAMPLVAGGDWKTLWGQKGPHRNEFLTTSTRRVLELPRMDDKLPS
ncbi:hypothetical protein A2U01_0060745, partial [Trifolium medium]|nr:hypothetical protein [Trifolium medium]